MGFWKVQRVRGEACSCSLSSSEVLSTSLPLSEVSSGKDETSQNVSFSRTPCGDCWAGSTIMVDVKMRNQPQERLRKRTDRTKSEEGKHRVIHKACLSAFSFRKGRGGHALSYLVYLRGLAGAIQQSNKIRRACQCFEPNEQDDWCCGHSSSRTRSV